MKILVLDDDHVLTMILADHLADRGHQVVPAYKGNLAAHFCEEEEFDLVIVDYVLAEMNGFEVLERLRQKNRKARAIIITGFPELLKDESKRLKELDVEAVLDKPFSFSKVDELIEKYNK
ncbi:MAG: response regulator [Gammaproteobacteria bacterium]|nr:response regulator [Gammaproteobacteria bacterium]